MPISPGFDLQGFGGAITAIISIVTATAVALWIAMVIWTFRDIRTRSRDVLAQVVATLVVAVLSVPGLLIYLILRPREALDEQYTRALEEEALLQAIEEKSACPGCGRQCKDDWRLCPYCHTKLRKICSQCNRVLELPWTICPYCEHPQTETSQPSYRATRIEGGQDF